jgi:hypothetical protein
MTRTAALPSVQLFARPLRMLTCMLVFCAAATTVSAQTEIRAPEPAPRLVGTKTTPKASGGFTKIALHPSTGALMTGPIASGTTIKYVIEAGSSSPGLVYPNLSIADALSAGLTYVAGSLQLPAGWSSNPNPPFSPNSQAVFSGMAYSGAAGFTYAVSNATAMIGTGSGDGYTPVIVGTKVFGFHHHINGSVSCWDTGSMLPCPAAAFSGVNTMNDMRFAILGSKIYLPGYATASPQSMAGIACYDASGAPCSVPFTPIANLTGGMAAGNLAGIVSFATTPSDIFIAIDSILYCKSAPAMGTCSSAVAPAFATGVMIPGGVASSISVYAASDILADDTSARIYWHSGSSLLKCVVVATGAPCWPPIPHNQSYGHLLSPVLSSTGAMTGVCVHSLQGGASPNSAMSGNAAPLCWNSSGVSAPPPPSLVSLLSYAPGMAHYTVMPYRLPAIGAINTTRTRVLFPGRVGNAGSGVLINTGGRALCFDYATLLPCAGFIGWAATAASIGRAGTGRLMSEYGYMTDPADPSCTYGLGDARMLFRFNTLTGAQGCLTKLWPLPNPSASFCDGKQHPITWGNVSIIGRPATLTGGTIVIRNGATVLMTIPVTSANAYSISSIPYSSNPNITMEFNPTYSTASPPSTGVYYVHISFTSNANPQICYEATTSCPAGASYVNKAVMTTGSSAALGSSVGTSGTTATAVSELASACDTVPPQPPSTSTCCPPMSGGGVMANMFTQTAHPAGTGYNMVFSQTNPATISFINGYVAYLNLLKFLCPTVDHLEVTFTPRTAAAIGGAFTGPSPATGHNAFTISINSSGLVSSPALSSQFGPTAFPPSATVYGIQASTVGVNAAGQPVNCGFDSEVCRRTTRFTWVYNVGARMRPGSSPLTIEK